MDQQLLSLHDVIFGWHNDALEFVRIKAPKIVVYLVIAFVLIRLLHMAARRLTSLSQRQELPSGVRAQQLRTLSSVIRGIGLFVVIFLTTMQILQVMGVDVAPLLASAGVVGLAVGFGAQTLVRDVINGFFVLMENQYDVGDVVKIGAVSGTVEHMTLRRTVLRDADGTLHNIPNSQIALVSNMTRDWTVTTIQVAVSYEENTDRVVELLREVAAWCARTRNTGSCCWLNPRCPASTGFCRERSTICF